MFKNKKSQFVVPLILLVGFLLIAGVIFFSQQSQATGLTEEQVQKLLDDRTLTEDVVDVEPDSTRDSNDDTSQGESTTDNTPPTELDRECKISGEWVLFHVKGKMRQDKNFLPNFPASKSQGIFKYTGTCSTDIYLEAGINPKTKTPLGIASVSGAIPTTPSWCDGNRNYYGHLWKNVNEGDLLRVNFRPETPDEDGAYKMSVGAYTGCLSDKTTDAPISTSGVTIVENSYTIRVSDNLYASGLTETSEASQSWEQKI